MSIGKCKCCCMTKIRSMIVRVTKANICGAEFTSGEDMRVVVDDGSTKRCGSIIVSVIHGPLECFCTYSCLVISPSKVKTETKCFIKFKMQSTISIIKSLKTVQNKYLI